MYAKSATSQHLCTYATEQAAIFSLVCCSTLLHGFPTSLVVPFRWESTFLITYISSLSSSQWPLIILPSKPKFLSMMCKAQHDWPLLTSLIRSPTIFLFTDLTPAALEATKFILALGLLNLSITEPGKCFIQILICIITSLNWGFLSYTTASKENFSGHLIRKHYFFAILPLMLLYLPF